MQAAQIIAGYTLGGADILRRAMGKKIKEVMEAQKQVFIDGAFATNGIERKTAEEIFGILEKFAEYGFNKSHSAAYAMISYRTAYLKANYPVEFMAALLSTELGNADKVSHFVEEASSMGIEVLGPDINESRENFTPVLERAEAPKNAEQPPKAGRIRFGLAAVKGVGDSAAKLILEERDAHGTFQDLRDFAQRVDGKACNRRVLECLIKTGAFEFSGIDRQHLLDSLDAIITEAADLEKDKASGQANMFDLLTGDASVSESTVGAYETGGATMGALTRLQYERELLGFYVSGHPLDQFAGLDAFVNSFSPQEELKHWDREGFRLVGVINNVVKRLTKRDNRPWCYFTLSTRSSSYQINVFPDAYEANLGQFEDGQLVCVTGEVRYDDDRQEVRLNANHLSPAEKAVQAFLETLIFYIKPDEPEFTSFVTELSDYLQANEGPTEVKLGVVVEPGRALVAELAPSLRCHFKPEAFKHFKRHSAVLRVEGEGKNAPSPERPRWERARA